MRRLVTITLKCQAQLDIATSTSTLALMGKDTQGFCTVDGERNDGKHDKGEEDHV